MDIAKGSAVKAGFSKMDANSIETLIRKGIPDAEVSITDLRGDGTRLSATVIAACFQGKPLLEQHRMVHAALGPHIGETIHALHITTRCGG